MTSRALSSSSDRARLEAMNAEIERLYKEGRDLDARNFEERANALARWMFRKVAA